MKRNLVFATILALWAPLAAQAADGTVAGVTVGAPVAAERFEVGPMLVERHGSRGSPMIFIPGLSGGPHVWHDAVREFGKDHVLYLVTLPGFDGHAAAGGDLVAGVDTWIGELIASRKLVKPVLVGHSLGATFSLAYAIKHSGQIGGVVAVDGLPVMPGTENMPPAQRPALAAGVKQRMAGMTGAAFATQQQAFMRGPLGVIDAGTADALAARSARSDPAAVAEYVAQVLALDLRGGLPEIGVPVLMIAPFHDADMKAGGMPMTAEGKAAYYKGLLAGTPRLNVVSLSPARHFAMLDQPRQFAAALRAYLEAL